MKIILTHEQADFDAVASLLGAYLLDETAVPISPRRINRNVGAFLTLYGQDLPFVDPRDLTAETIDTVTLVDTQSLISVKGMTQATRVYVVDHHPARDDLPGDWVVKTGALGATTTFFVEALHERGCVLTIIQATLLLLGIYEDTGSLTYTRTTPRDVRAAAFLMEQGASLEVAASFLQHPLSLAQQALYDRLRETAETHHIHGHTIIIACESAQDLTEEISTVAHKLRDLLEPDGLFLLVTTRSGVQLIARSTSDNIDVGALALHFNGGGHDRAAAALIRTGDTVGGQEIEPDLLAVRAELLRVLPQHVRPAITVAQIMSARPQVITPETPVQEVAQRMQRYGYEGYPVVASGKLVGLLTRRAVDRALTHKLNLTAASLMSSGDVTVRPDDSIEHLQNLMIDTGWGQIPVVNPEGTEIIGIVTRTDLIKTLAAEPKVPGYQNLSARLESALPPARLALLKTAAEMAHQQRAALFIVGGFVRDLLLERPSIDFDLVVEGDAIALARALARRYGGRVTSHARFGTAKWHISEIRADLATVLGGSLALKGANSQLAPEAIPVALDLVSARTEFYTHPTALPTVERGSIKLDLHRRDFTINTLALRLDGAHYGELHDYWGGLDDLHGGLVRVLHSLSFVDDPTRMLRAVRFEVRFDFQIELRTLELLQEARSLIDRISGDRIRNELNHILAERRAAQMLARLDELDLLVAIHPVLEGDEWLYGQINSLSEIEPEPVWGLKPGLKGIPMDRALAYTLWTLRAPPEGVRRVVKRLKLRSDLATVLLEASSLWADLPSLKALPPSGIVGRLEGVPALAQFAVYLANDDSQLKALLEDYVFRWQGMTPRVTGHELRARGLPPGPAYRTILARLRAAWLDGEINSPEAEDALLETLLQEHQRHES